MLLIERILTELSRQGFEKFLLKAQHMVEQQDVLLVRLSDGYLVTRVKDKQSKIFTAHANLKNWNSKEYQCLCGQLMPCLHLLAGMIFWLNGQKQSTPLNVKNIYTEASWESQNQTMTQVEWQSKFTGTLEQGFQYQIWVHQDDIDWDIGDIIVFLLERYPYSVLMQKDEQAIFEIVNAQGYRLRLPWSRIKWFLEKIIAYQVKFEQSSMKLDYHWELMRDLGQYIQDTATTCMDDEWMRRLNHLLNFKSLVVQLRAFNTDLRDYQWEGVRWLYGLYQSGFGGMLADDMGLGKTIQVLAYLQFLLEQQLLLQPVLIVVPTSLLANWVYECQKFAPTLKVMLYYGKTKDFGLVTDNHLVITSYGMVQRYLTGFKKIKFSHIILDEAQLIKNFQSQKSQALKTLQAPHKICLTGTPLENHLGELWSLIDFAVPNLLGTRSQFKKQVQTPIEKHHDAATLQKVVARLAPFILRRRKQEVLDDLPAKTRIVQKIRLQGEQLELYQTLAAVLAEKVQLALNEKGLLHSRWIILDALLKLRQVCCDSRLLPRLWRSNKALESAKLKFLMKMIQSLLEEDRSVLVFSQFTSMLTLIEQELQKKCIPCLMLSGKTQNRQELVERFQNGNVPIFLLSLKAGGLGLNLTKADTVIHYEPWWNPAVSVQATDRIYRIGQTQAVFEYHLITEGTVEEKMLQIQEQKFQLFDQTVESVGRIQAEWTEEMVMQFFEPLS